MDQAPPPKLTADLVEHCLSVVVVVLEVKVVGQEAILAAVQVVEQAVILGTAVTAEQEMQTLFRERLAQVVLAAEAKEAPLDQEAVAELDYKAKEHRGLMAH